ncbi:MAG: PIG-L family deacetylase [Clostridia bacterium]|nr:PIG-L family deacetylase [Clostridia bacterium]
MKILAVGAHPDDLEIACYGTLARYINEGHSVAVCHVSNGNLGHVVIEPDELAEIRSKEAANAAAVIGAKHYTLDIDDQYVDSNNDEQVRKLVTVIREVQPDFIITHSEDDYHRDHVQTYQLVFRATCCASLAHYYDGTDLPTAEICPLYQMDTLANTGFDPTEYVDISDTIELKLKALACHESQIVWMKEHDKIDFIDFVRSSSKVRGYQCGVGYAEGFRPDMHYGRLTTKRLLP